MLEQSFRNLAGMNASLGDINSDVQSENLDYLTFSKFREKREKCLLNCGVYLSTDFSETGINVSKKLMPIRQYKIRF